jgi:hypothetical protein
VGGSRRAVEQREDDEVLGFVGDAGEQPQLWTQVSSHSFGSGRLDQRVGQVVDRGGLDAGEMLADGAAELNEGRAATARRQGLFGDAA